MSDIKLTVGLPMFDSEKIAWLAFESLCRQKEVNFDWELLIAEEVEGAFGLDNIKKYYKRLESIRCKRIEYKSIKNRIPLALKWRILGKMSSPESICFLMQDADDYSQPFRLRETYDLFIQKGADFVSTSKGVFYTINTGRVTQYNGEGSRAAVGKSVKTSLMRQLPKSDRKSSVDAWVFRTVTKIKGRPLKVVRNPSANWNKGIYTNGLNNISRIRSQMCKELKPPFSQYKGKIENCIPADILERLIELRHSQMKFNERGSRVSV